MSKDLGWIKLHRRFVKWEWYDDANVMRVFLHCLLMANHEENSWRGEVIKRGEFITSYAKLASQLRLSVQQIRTAISKLQKTNEITIRATSKYTVLSINKYNSYQENEKANNKQGNKQVTGNTTNEQQTNNKQVTTNKNDKNVKNDKEGVPSEAEYEIPKKEQVEEYFRERGMMLESDIPLEAENFINHFSDCDWKNSKGKRIKFWRRQANTWINKYLQFNEKRIMRSKVENKNEPIIGTF